MRILVIEDERDLAEALTEGLILDGYTAEYVLSGNAASELLAHEWFDLVMLDLNLPERDGLEILRELRERNVETKILILSARDSIESRVAGLDAGANDYLVKPFAFAELEARVRNLLRWEFTRRDDMLTVGEISLDLRSQRALARNTELNLRRKELDILEVLIREAGRPVSQEELFERAWGSNRDLFSNAVRVHVSALRKKLIAALQYDPIRTEVGRGYILQEGKTEASNA